MARIRTVKPEFWTSAQVMELSRDARLLFVGMWNFCDDAGIHPASEKRLKAEVFPADDLTAADISQLLAELFASGLLDEYEIGGERYWIVTGWHHQKIDQPTFKYPTPAGSIPDGPAKRRQTRMKVQDSPNVHRTHGEHSPNVREVFEQCSPPEGKGKDKEVNLRHSNGSDPSHAGAREMLDPAAVAVALIGWERDRHKAARGIAPSNPHVIELADLGVTLAQLREAYDDAVADRDACSDTTPVNAGFVRTFIEKRRRPQRPKADDWQRSDAGIVRKAKEVGVSARMGESYAALRDRVQSKLDSYRPGAQ